MLLEKQKKKKKDRIDILLNELKKKELYVTALFKELFS
jgi:hypothetical protein